MFLNPESTTSEMFLENIIDSAPGLFMFHDPFVKILLPPTFEDGLQT